VINHSMIRCSHCDTVISECLCPSDYKEVSYETCEVCKKGKQPTWGSGGKQIPYRELSDDHLHNILKDGYRNPHLVDEAWRRGMRVKPRPIDKLDPMELVQESSMFLEACASCAISGNVFGDVVCRAWDEDKGLFYHYLNQHLESMEKEDDET
jgi:hypothetical protein